MHGARAPVGRLGQRPPYGQPNLRTNKQYGSYMHLIGWYVELYCAVTHMTDAAREVRRRPWCEGSRANTLGSAAGSSARRTITYA